MNQQRGLLLELRDVKLDEGVEECPRKERGAAAAFGPASRSTAGARRTASSEGLQF